MVILITGNKNSEEVEVEKGEEANSLPRNLSFSYAFRRMIIYGARDEFVRALHLCTHGW